MFAFLVLTFQTNECFTLLVVPSFGSKKFQIHINYIIGSHVY